MGDCGRVAELRVPRGGCPVVGDVAEFAEVVGERNVVRKS
jgi:hypothetical protein